MLEEEVLDTHKLVMDNTTKFLNDAHSVFSATHEVDYDQEGKMNLFAFARLRFSIGFPLSLSVVFFFFVCVILNGALPLRRMKYLYVPFHIFIITWKHITSFFF